MAGLFQGLLWGLAPILFFPERKFRQEPWDDGRLEQNSIGGSWRRKAQAVESLGMPMRIDCWLCLESAGTGIVKGWALPLHWYLF